MDPGGEVSAARPVGYACPSAPAEPGAGLLGVLGPDGRIHNLRTLIPVDGAFLDAVRVRGAPEERMRFSNRCQTSGCSQWTGTRCGVIDRAMKEMKVPGTSPVAELSPCTIRGTCRWFAQSGPDACATCAFIVTDTRQMDTAAE
ncbi:MAG: hypothetical protein ACOH2H_25230 [Cypionkella sp.]